MLWPSRCCMRVQVLEKFRLQGNSHVGDIYCTKALQNAACQGEARLGTRGLLCTNLKVTNGSEQNSAQHKSPTPGIQYVIEPHLIEPERARRRHWMLRSSSSAAAPSHTTQEQPSRAQERVSRGGCASGRAPASADLQLWYGYFQADTGSDHES